MSSRDVFLIEKAISLPLVAAAVYFLSPTQMLAAFIVFGMGHILVAYVYQWRAKKRARMYGGLGITALLIVLFALLRVGRIDLLILATGAVFLIHFLFDEVFLAGKQLSALRAMVMTPIWLLYVGTLLNTIEHIHVMLDVGLISAAIVMIYASTMVRMRRTPDLLDTYFLGITALLFYLTVLQIFVPLQVLIGALVLLHYTGWYISYYFKVRSNPDRLRTYLLSVLVVNTVVFGLYWLFLKLGTRSILAYLFLPAYFYIWTLVHTAISIRVSDWKGLLARE